MGGIIEMAKKDSTTWEGSGCASVGMDTAMNWTVEQFGVHVVV